MLITKDKTNWLFLLIVISVAVIIGGGILFLINKQDFQLTPLSEIKKSESTGWQRYANAQYGFEINYPRAFVVSNENNRSRYGIEYMVSIVSSKDARLGQTPKDLSIRIDISESKNRQEGRSDWEPININGKKALVFCGSPNNCETEFRADAYVYDILTTKDPRKDVQTNQILSTFKLIGKEEVGDWQIYKNEKYGFEMKHPKNWLFEAQEFFSVSENSLDINSMNIEIPDIGCSRGFVGFGIQVGQLKDHNQDFSSFVKSEISQNGFGSSDQLEQIIVDNHRGFKVQGGGDEGFCFSGPAYFVEQDTNHYITFVSSYHKDNQKEGLEIFNQMISSVKF